MGRKKTTFIPFKDMLVFIGFISYVWLFLKFQLGISLIFDNADFIFLFLGGLGLMTQGGILRSSSYLDSVQRNEVKQLLKLLTLIVGIFSVFASLWLLFSGTIPESLVGAVGIVSLLTALYIILDLIIERAMRRLS